MIIDLPDVKLPNYYFCLYLLMFNMCLANGMNEPVSLMT